MSNRDYLTIQELCDVTKISRATIQSMRYNNTLHFFGKGNLLNKVMKKDVIELFKNLEGFNCCPGFTFRELGFNLFKFSVKPSKAAKILGVSVPSINKWSREGKIDRYYYNFSSDKCRVGKTMLSIKSIQEIKKASLK